MDHSRAFEVLGPWDLLVDENHLYVGAFKTVAGLTRTNLARFEADGFGRRLSAF